MNINEEYLICPSCGSEEYVVDWMKATAMVVVGTEDISAVGNPLVDTDPNYFYICPNCGSQSQGVQQEVGGEVPRVLYVDTDEDSHENLMAAGSRGFVSVAWSENGGVLVSDIEMELATEDADEIFVYMNEGRGDAYGSSEVTLSSGLKVKLEY